MQKNCYFSDSFNNYWLFFSFFFKFFCLFYIPVTAFPIFPYQFLPPTLPFLPSPFPIHSSSIFIQKRTGLT